MGLFARASPEQLAEAGELVDPSLHRSKTDWDELQLPARVLDLATRSYDALGDLVGVPAAEQGDTRAGLGLLQAELTAYYDESFDVARTRTGAFVRREKRKAVRRVREEGAQHPAAGRLTAVRRTVPTGWGGARDRCRPATGRRRPRRWRGTRVGLDIPKQLIKIAGKTILEHTLDAFEAHPRSTRSS